MKLVSTLELAEFMGVHRRTVADWVKQGCPIEKRSQGAGHGSHKFKPKDVVNWLNKRAVMQVTGDDDPDIVSAEEAKRRKVLAEAGIQELELVKRKGSVVELSDIQRDLSSKLAEVRSNMLKIPERTALRLVGESDETRIKQVIRGEVLQTLEAIVDYSFDEESSDERE